MLSHKVGETQAHIFHCNRCNYTSITEAELNVHKNKHTGEIMKDRTFAAIVKALSLEDIASESYNVQSPKCISSSQYVTRQITKQQKRCSSASPEGKPSTKQQVTQEKVNRK